MTSWRDVGVLYKRELRSALRERNIVIYSILIPVCLYPLLMWLVVTAMTFARGQEEKRPSRILLHGLPAPHALLAEELGITPGIQVVQGRADEDHRRLLRQGQIDALVECYPADSTAGSNVLPGAPEAPPGALGAVITFDESRGRSQMARDRAAEVLDRYRAHLLRGEAVCLGITPESFQGFWVTTENRATGSQMGRFLLGLLLPLTLIIMLSMGATYPAIDTTAGERERSTWETILSTRASRGDLMLAKYLYVSTMALIAGALNLLAMILSMKGILAPVAARSAEGFSFGIPPQSIPLILLVAALLALFVSAGMMILASFARTFKDGQSMTTPFLMITMIPVMFLSSPGIEFTMALALVPIVNVALVLREAVAGVYRWPQIGVTIAVEAVCVVLALRLATAITRHEDFLLGSYEGKMQAFIRGRILGRGGSGPRADRGGARSRR